MVGAGNLTRPQDAAFLVTQLRGRRDAIQRRYFARLSPVTDVEAAGRELCAVDLARKGGLFPASMFSYTARVHEGASLAVQALPDGRLCTTVPAEAVTDQASRYRVVDIQNGQAPGALHVHVYDLGGDRGLRVVGIQREEGPR